MTTAHSQGRAGRRAAKPPEVNTMRPAVTPVSSHPWRLSSQVMARPARTASTSSPDSALRLSVIVLGSTAMRMSPLGSREMCSEDWTAASTPPSPTSIAPSWTLWGPGGGPRYASDEPGRGPADSAAWSGGGSAERGGGGEGLQHGAAYLARLLSRIAVADLVAPPEATQVGSVGFEHVARHLLDVPPPTARALLQGLAGRRRGSRIEGAPAGL